jgi:Flp pilus assembly protein TadD
MDPCNAFAWHAIGQLAIHGGDLSTAIQALRVATRLVPGHYGAFTSLGEAYERSGRGELAREAYRTALTIHPQHPPALEGVARIQASR